MNFVDPLGLQAGAAALKVGCTLLRSRNGPAIGIGVAVIAGGAAVTALEGCEQRSCGNCTPAELAALEFAKDLFCSQKRACRPGQDLWTLSTNKHKNINCAIARDRIRKRCFGDGDAGHQQASAWMRGEQWASASSYSQLPAER